MYGKRIPLNLPTPEGGRRFNYQHNLALKYHCRLAFETAHPRFGFPSAAHAIALEELNP